MPIDAKKIALIHIVKKDLRLTDDEYRAVLQSVAGVKSSKDLDEAGFRKLMNFLVRSVHYRVNPLGMTLKQKMFIRHLAQEMMWNEEHLTAFIQKYYHQPRLEDLSRKEAIKLIESLKQVKEHQKKNYGPQNKN